MNIKINYVDIIHKCMYTAILHFDNKIKRIEKIADALDNSLPYLIPGFIDSHVHIESSMLIPSEFARLAVLHGTVATVSDPHEIANVCGIEGVQYMIENGKKVPFKFFFGAPSCVPATTFETTGATLDSHAVKTLLNMPDINYLSEMMNFPGVLHNDKEVMKKIKYAQQLNKPVDGHAPGLSRKDAQIYIDAGISTDHECVTYNEAKEKLELGMKILIREGSAAKNFDDLIDLLNDYEDEIMFCSDDKHPDSLVLGHINELCKRAVLKGINIYKILKAACINPAKHYNLNVGLLKEGDDADFIIVNNLKDFNVESTYIEGKLVSNAGESYIQSVQENIINNFIPNIISQEDLVINTINFINDNGEVPVIEAVDGQLITNKLWLEPTVNNGVIESDINKDILKIVVVNRYKKAAPAIAFIKNFGLKSGAIASSVAHDSHNVVAVGTTDEEIMLAVNALMKLHGGICVCQNKYIETLALPVAGLMSNEDAFDIANKYEYLDKKSKALGSPLQSPFMTLSFMALLVIPHLKLSDKGLFDCDSFKFM